MRIRVGYELAFDCPEVTPMILMFTTHYTCAANLVVPDRMVIEPAVPVTTYRDGFGNWCIRLVAPAGRIRMSARTLLGDSGEPDRQTNATCQTDVPDLPPEVLVFLLCSRYCKTDRLADEAWSLGHGPTGVGRVRAICDFVHQHITFSYPDARSTRAELEALDERKGVCRDFAHLAIAFCRCQHPARYCTGYLGDIGVPPLLSRWTSPRGSRRTLAETGTPSTPATTSRALVACSSPAGAMPPTFQSAMLRRPHIGRIRRRADGVPEASAAPYRHPRCRLVNLIRGCRRPGRLVSPLLQWCVGKGRPTAAD